MSISTACRRRKVVPLDHLRSHGARLGTLHRLCARRAGAGAERRRDRLGAGPRSHHPACPGSPSSPGCRPTIRSAANPMPLNTRVALKNVLAQAAELGFGFNLGIECEIFVLQQNSDGTLSVPNPDDKLTKPCYDLRPLPRQFPLARQGRDLHQRARLGPLFLRSRRRQRPIRVRFQLRRRAHHVRPAHLLPLHDQALRQGRRPVRDHDAQAVRRQDRHAARISTCRSTISRAARNLFAGAPADDPRGLGLTEIGYHFIGGILRHGRALCAPPSRRRSTATSVWCARAP